MAITLTTVAPNENAVINASSAVFEVKASSDAGTITGATLQLNNGSILAMTFDSATLSWKKSMSFPLGPVIAKIVVTDSTSATATTYINFSRSTSTSAPASVNVGHPVESATVRSPGVILQADISRPTEVVRVEASVDQGVSWIPMAIPPTTGGS